MWYNRNKNYIQAGRRLATFLLREGGWKIMTTYEALSLVNQSNLVLLGILSIVVMLFVAKKEVAV
jgi:hypothetical protein